MKTTILVRHGETPDIIENRISGQRDVPLTDNGRLQAVESGWKIARLGIVQIVSSDLLRAKETAEIISRELRICRPTTDSRFRERNWGALEGTRKYPVARFSEDYKPDGGESLAELRERVLPAFDGLPDKTLLVAHAGVIRCILDYCGMKAETIPVGSYIVVQRETSPIEQQESKVFELDGGVISRGGFSGIAAYIQNAGDLAKCQMNSLILLCNCKKDIAVEALRYGSPAINMTGALTAHLTCGRTNTAPFAVANFWTNGLPAEGEYVNVKIKQDVSTGELPPLPDIPLRKSADVSVYGGKGAGLLMLDELGMNVPDYLIIDTSEIKDWQNSGDPLKCAEKWRVSHFYDNSVLWAARSSADSEDGENDAMSGAFDSILKLAPAEIPGAIVKILDSVNNFEITERIKAGALAQKPNMAVVVQRMVENILFAGAVFLPSPTNPSVFILEANVGKTGESLMDGTSSSDISASFDANANLMELNALDQFQNGNYKEYILNAARQALKIYLATGRGDVEFAVDANGVCWWLQARPLNAMFVSVVRTGCHPAARKYYQQIAFHVAEANCLPEIYFRLINPNAGIFGYSVGIIQRDVLFQKTVQRNFRHLEKVIEFGRRVTEKFHTMIAHPEQYASEELLNTLILHSAVQVPFSIPVSAFRKERFHSWTAGETNRRGMLETLLDGFCEHFCLGLNGDELLNILRQPVKTNTVILGKRALLNLSRVAEPTDDMFLECIITDLRDVPDLSEQGLEKIRSEWRIRAAEISANPERGAGLEKEIDDLALAMLENNKRREGLIRDLKRDNDPQYEEFKLWADYLAMKAEVNEAHSVYRGRLMIYFAKTGFSVER